MKKSILLFILFCNISIIASAQRCRATGSKFPPPPRGPITNNGVGNGMDPQPPGNPPINDGPGTGPGNPRGQKATPDTAKKNQPIPLESGKLFKP